MCKGDILEVLHCDNREYHDFFAKNGAKCHFLFAPKKDVDVAETFFGSKKHDNRSNGAISTDAQEINK